MDHRLRMASHRDECLLSDGRPDQRLYHTEPRKLSAETLAPDHDHVGHHRLDAGNQHLQHQDFTPHRESGGHLSYPFLFCIADPAGVPGSAEQSILCFRLVPEQGRVGAGWDLLVRRIADRRFPVGW